MNFPSPWQEQRSDHFVIHFYPGYDELAKAIVRNAEILYDRTARQIGFARYQDFWTWEDRVRIVLYPDRDVFVEQTGLPQWSRGGAIYHAELTRQRMIVSFVQDQKFLDDVLPHEIGHLILRDFVGINADVPIWFEEGVAQLQEKNRREFAYRLLPELVKKDGYWPLSVFSSVKIYEEQDSLLAAVFYMQSYAIVDFMISKYGSDRFARLCRCLRDGISFEESLRRSYVGIFDSSEDLQKKWVSYMKNF